MKKTSYVILFLIAVSFSFFYYLYNKDLNLVTKGKVKVYATVHDAMTWPHPLEIKILPKDHIFPVVECVDEKTYLIYKIRLPDGSYGFVLEGDFKLMRDNKESYCK